jgi:biotin operon repressor
MSCHGPPGRFQHPSQINLWAAACPTLKGQESAKDILAMIVDMAASSGSCYVNDATIAEKLSISRATVKRGIAALKGVGIVEVNRGGGPGKASKYTLPLDRDRPRMGITDEPHSPQGGPRMGITDEPLRRANGVHRWSERVSPVDGMGITGAPNGVHSCEPPTIKNPDLTLHQNQGPGTDPDPDGGFLDRGGEEKPRTVRDWTIYALRLKTPEAVEEAARAIAEKIDSYSLRVVADPFWKAIRGDLAAATLREAASHADAELEATGDRRAAGRHWGAVLNGKTPIHAASEAANNHRRRKNTASFPPTMAEWDARYAWELEIARLCIHDAASKAAPSSSVAKQDQQPLTQLVDEADAELRRLADEDERLRLDAARRDQEETERPAAVAKIREIMDSRPEFANRRGTAALFAPAAAGAPRSRPEPHLLDASPEVESTRPGRRRGPENPNKSTQEKELAKLEAIKARNGEASTTT